MNSSLFLDALITEVKGTVTKTGKKLDESRNPNSQTRTKMTRYLDSIYPQGSSTLLLLCKVLNLTLGKARYYVKCEGCASIEQHLRDIIRE